MLHKIVTKEEQEHGEFMGSCAMPSPCVVPIIKRGRDIGPHNSREDSHTRTRSIEENGFLVWHMIGSAGTPVHGHASELWQPKPC